MEHRRIATNGIELHVVMDGPENGPLVILLHGFPEFWYAWRRQIPHLAAAGYRVWAPDQRGYNLSDKPRGVAAYTIAELVADVVGLIDAAGRENAIVIGHDWGGAVAWAVAARVPNRITRLVAMNAPFGPVLFRHLRSDWAQLRRSWYMFFFQIPVLPEALAQLGNWSAVARALVSTSRHGTFSDEDLARYREAWSQPNAYQSMVNWYRAAFQRRPQSTGGPPPRVTVPTLVIWGAQDAFLRAELAQESVAYCDDARVTYIQDATHWVQHEEPDRVNDLITTFIGV